jgi:hypothetical protein
MLNILSSLAVAVQVETFRVAVEQVAIAQTH